MRLLHEHENVLGKYQKLQQHVLKRLHLLELYASLQYLASAHDSAHRSA